MTSCPPGRLAAACVSLLFALGSLATPAGARAQSLASLSGEALRSPTGTSALTDVAAEDKKALGIWSDVMASAPIDLPTGARSVTVRLRGTSCQGPATAQVTLDGAPLFSADVTSATYVTVGVVRPVAAGRHTVAVGLVNDFRTGPACDRSLAVDSLSFDDSDALPPGAIAGDAAGVAAEPTAATLAWAPPELITPTTIDVPQGDQWLTLDKRRDYVLRLPTTVHRGQIIVAGGHNVLIRGGAVQIPVGSSKNVGIGIRDNEGTVHIEGVLFDGSNGQEMDAINISAPRSIVQIENVRATGLFGTLSTNHSDVIQPYGGVAALRVDHLSGDSNYQGLFTRPDRGPIGSVDVRNTDLSFDDSTAGSTGGYLLWMTTGCDMAPTRLRNVYVQGRSTTLLGASVWPSTHDAACPARIVNGTISWPKLPVDGGVIGGAPTAGPFVPPGVAGTGYLSPGYTNAARVPAAALAPARRSAERGGRARNRSRRHRSR